jgi:hypothetical protein
VAHVVPAATIADLAAMIVVHAGTTADLAATTVDRATRRQVHRTPRIRLAGCGALFVCGHPACDEVRRQKSG